MGAGEEVEIDWGILGGPDHLISMAQEPTTIRNAIGTGPGPWRVQLGHLQLRSRGLFDGENAANGAGHVVKKQGKCAKANAIGPLSGLGSYVRLHSRAYSPYVSFLHPANLSHYRYWPGNTRGRDAGMV